MRIDVRKQYSAESLREVQLAASPHGASFETCPVHCYNWPLAQQAHPTPFYNAFYMSCCCTDAPWAASQMPPLSSASIIARLPLHLFRVFWVEALQDRIQSFSANLGIGCVSVGRQECIA